MALSSFGSASTPPTPNVCSVGPTARIRTLRAFVRRVVAGHINATLASDERARGIVLTWAASKRLDIVTHGSEAAS